MLDQPVRARPATDGHQVIEITVRGGYWPAAVRARAGLPLRIVFHRLDHEACTERVVFSTPRLERRLAPDGPTTIDLPAQPAGEIRFTCGMGRYRGRIELVDGRLQSFIDRLRARRSPVRGPLATAAILWACSLPLIVVIGADALGMTSAVLLAGGALVASVAGSFWAFGRSSHPS